MIRKLLPIIVGLLVATTTARADSLTMTITVTNGAATFSGPTTFKPGDVLTVNCPAKSGCAGLTIKQGTADVQATKSGDTWVATLGSASTVVALEYEKTKRELSQDTGSGSDQQPPPSNEPDANGFTTCPTELPSGQILVDTDGNVLANQLDSFAEDQKLIVWVTGPASAFTGLQVTRKSAFRDVTVLHVLGNPDNINYGTGKQGKSEPRVCKRFELADFAAGQGAFSITNTATKSSNEIDFAVHPVYNGMFTVGFVATWLDQPSFYVRTVGAASEIARKPATAVNGRYMLQYTAFAPLQRWAPNTFHSGVWNQIVGASVGVLLDDPTKNVSLGATIGPVNGLSLVLGAHIGEVQQLAGGVKLGDAIAADATVPTDTKWAAGFYLGVALDVSVASKLFVSLFSK